MLKSLSIRDIVLIERLELELAPGLTVLTGETGAGKSIVLDALGLALGGRAERDLVRRGAGHGMVAACFDPPPDHPARAILAEQGLAGEGGGELVLRRSLAADGRSRAFLDDAPVAGQLLRRVGASLVAVHGQHDTHGLLDPAVQRALLDAFAGAGQAAAALRAAWEAWRTAEAGRRELAREVERSAREADDLRHRAAELEALAAEPGEEARLAEARARLQGRERLLAALGESLEALAGSGGARDRLLQAARRVERIRALAEAPLGAALEALERARLELEEAEAGLGALRAEAGSTGDLETVEARLFALRDAARKHRVPVDELPALLLGTRADLARLEDGAEALARATGEAAIAEAAFRAAAARLSGLRAAAAARLAAAVEAELAPLRLERARLEIALEPLAEAEWGPEGAERVAFLVATNPGQPPGPLARIASGGELARLMLALELVLARLDPTPTLVFDEIDAGIGGATADAVGERLARLARERQVLVVTHAPQVAARASHHLAVRKRLEPAGARVEVVRLGPAERRQEVARMLAGAEVTEAARAAAASLIELAGSG